MRDRGSLYGGMLLLLLGGLFLLIQVADTFSGFLGIRLGWGNLWPLIILYLGLAFWLPLLIWWDGRAKIAGLVVPAAIVTTNGLILLYQSLSGDWGSWAYVWALEPASVGLGLLLLYFLTNRDRGLLVAAGIVGGIGLFFFIIFASAFGGALRILGPLALISIGVFFLLRGAKERSGGDAT